MKTDKNNKNNKSEEDEKKKGRRRFWLLLLLILLLLLLFSLFQWKIKERNNKLATEHRLRQLEYAIEEAQRIADSLAKLDSLFKADSIRLMDSLRIADSLARARADSLARTRGDFSTKARGDSLAKAVADSLARARARADSLARARDTIPPVPSILPPAGRYFKPVNLRVECDKPKCETEMSIGDSLNAVKGKIENYNKTGRVYFRARDSLGKLSRWEFADYDMASDNNCAENSFPVPVKGKSVCVDVYAYPNRAGEKPRNMVSHEAAGRLCEQAGKRLCTIEEWQTACKGKSNLRYPYGNVYNQRKCVTDLRNAKEPNRSGFAEHCRSWYGMYDMSGNVWEWTSTPAQRAGLFLVAGGAWNTQNASSCSETKFSFYPQNEYAFVGFRCCK
ncbi:MAG: SUMF1/EgtB/PvdO family nonheme iron enzyme [Fibromonadaceae bacterium]|jgi:hypothetical protein|nr:SUMF1/EgtB/PvdO family nonheme iron enzyme [Fibromonadaceae bacterium]